MTLIKNNPLKFEEMPLRRPSVPSIKKEIKRGKEININNMGSGAIIGHLASRHRFPLVITYALAASVLLVIHW